MKNLSGKKTGYSFITFINGKRRPFLFYSFLFLNSFTIHAQSVHKTGNRKIPQSLEQQVNQTLRKNSQQLQLIENNGQESLPAEVVAYFTSSHETVFIEKDRLRIIITQRASRVVGPVNQKDKTEAGNGLPASYHANTFSILFKGAKGFSSLQKSGLLPVKRFFTGNNGLNRTAVSAGCYAEIVLKDLYEGIDLRLYSQENGHLEFDWIIWPGADPDRIRMSFSGQKELKISPHGHLEIGLPMGIFNMHLPESYMVTSSGKQLLPVQFTQNQPGEIGFKGMHRNSTYPQVIDPDLLWGTYFDGGQAGFDEYLYAIEYSVDSQLIYCAGAVNLQLSLVYATALHAGYDSTFAASKDALIYTLTKDGQFVHTITYLGGSGEDVAIGLSLSPSFVYVSGYTASSNFPITKVSNGGFPAFDSVYHGANDGFVAVFSPALDKLIYCSYLGGDGADNALTIRALSDSVFYISLSAKDTLPEAVPDYTAAFADSIFEGNSEAWIGKFSSFNQLIFGTYIGGNNDDLVNDFQVLSDGSIVFAGNTKNITEINETIPDNASGQEALFGKIHVPLNGSVSFDIIDKFGGSNNDLAWGIFNLGDSVSMVVGETNSSNFPLGSGPVFQNTKAGNYDGFIAKIYNNGGPGYKATFTGGSDEDILVSIRPVTVNNRIALLGWGTTASSDLSTRNFNSGTFYSNANRGGLDMMFVICDMNLKSKYYLSYIGGSANDYLGITGAPVGSNHLFYNSPDSALYLGTTTHSSQTTHTPLFVGRGIADILNNGVPVFDELKGNSNNDTHVIIAISTRALFSILPLKWVDYQIRSLADCGTLLQWTTTNNEYVSQYHIERSTDGVHFTTLDAVQPATGNSGQYFIAQSAGQSLHFFYRINAVESDGKSNYSAVLKSRSCGPGKPLISIYPSIVHHSLTIAGLESVTGGISRFQLTDAAGRIVQETVIPAGTYSREITLHPAVTSGLYFVSVRTGTGSILYSGKIIVQH